MNFDKKFSIYDKNACIQKSVANNLINFLQEIGVEKNKKILEIGCGTGIFTKEFIKNFSPQNLILNDIYDVKEYLKNIEYDRFLLGDIENLTLPESNMVISSSVFQWLKNFPKAMEEISKSTKELGFSIYLEGNLEEIKEHFGVSLKYLTLDNVVEILTSLFSKVKWRKETIEINFSSPLEALRHLKNTGVTGFDRSTIEKIRSYNKTSLTYSVGYFYCSSL